MLFQTRIQDILCHCHHESLSIGHATKYVRHLPPCHATQANIVSQPRAIADHYPMLTLVLPLIHPHVSLDLQQLVNSHACVVFHSLSQ